MASVRLYLKDNISIVFFEILLVLFILVLYWLDGFRNVDTAVYSIVITLILTCTYLCARYIMRQSFYKKVTRMPKTMEDALQKNAKTPEHMQTEEFIHILYKIYQLEVQALYAKQNRHLQFMNQWVHQMKTPLAVLELLLQDNGELDKKSVQEEVDRMKRGLETVLMNARIDTFEEDMKIEQVSLRQLIVEAVNEHKRLFIAHRVYPNIAIDETLMVPTDSKWMKFIIGQFITNAVKYTFEEGKKVYLSAELTDAHIVLIIRDEGIGIPASDLKRVTRAFFTGENGRKTGESTGMGLYLAQEICDKLGHQLIIESEVGKGTKMTVLFHHS
ncbi:sensor histidine kinase [Viridibacillus sp. YIM B01967]|uniref:histidine kinase n=1 Tax=Viridibacillus soli TaxID=2798301 RepID=A0ABS1HAD2_9BACL|nr:sensor histidine kinase [Viridibacillus soli]MBK3495978.1 sensor histidine kinase [Viridibacillus soli]